MDALPDQAHAAILIRWQPYLTARYTSALTIYDEALVDGRWIGRYWSGHGFVEPERLLNWEKDAGHTPQATSGLDLVAFEEAVP